MDITKKNLVIGELKIDPVYQIMGILIVVILLLNFDRLFFAEMAPMRRLDVADWYIDKFSYCGKFWRSPSEYVWNASILRGWPIELGSINPQNLGCLLGAVLPVEYVFPVFQVILECLIAVGSFLFLYSLLAYNRTTSLLGALLNLTIFYWYNENPVVTQVSALPALCAFLGVGRFYIHRFFRIIVLLLVITISYPPYVVPLMPIVHFILVLFIFSQKNRIKNLIYVVVFWSIFGLFNAPTVVGYILNISASNRDIWSGAGQSGNLLPQLLVFSTSHLTLFPALVTLVYISRQNYKKVSYGLSLIAAVLFCTALIQSTVWNGLTIWVPFIQKMSFVFGRMYNFIGFTIFLLGSYLINSSLAEKRKHVFRRLIGSIGVCVFLAVAMVAVNPHSKILALFLFCLSMLTGLFLIFNPLRFSKNLVYLAVCIFVFLLPFRLTHSFIFEDIYSSNLYIDPFDYQSDLKAHRIVTVVPECFPDEYYPAQSSVKGYETLDGVTVFYDKRDARYWLNFIKKDDSCSAAYFRDWNNRVELTSNDLKSNPGIVYKWLWLNNVSHLRSKSAITHSSLDLKQTESVGGKSRWRDIFLGIESILDTHFLYQIRNPTSRVFAIPAEILPVAKIPMPDDEEEELLQKINVDNRQNIKLIHYSPSSLEFQGNFDRSKAILSSTNFNKNWSLHIDNKHHSEGLTEGPFGMIQIIPIEGEHTYRLSYESSYLRIAIPMVLATILLIVFITLVGKKYPDFGLF